MERPVTLKPLSIADENSAIHRKKATVDGKSKTSKQVAKKGGVAHESRKALNDITNKSSIHIDSQRNKSENKKCNIVEAEAQPKKKISAKEELNIAEEGFLHDHNKCINAQKTALELNFWDTVLPGHDSKDLIKEKEKGNPENEKCYPELEEISIPEFSGWFKCSWKSPPSSPAHWDSPLHSPFAWELNPMELVLKEDKSDGVYLGRCI